MIYKSILSPDAKVSVRSAALWYLEHDLELPFRFAAELKSTLSRIERNPYLFALIGARLRRAQMKRFPYWVYFTPSEGLVYVVDVVHQRRLNPPSRP